MAYQTGTSSNVNDLLDKFRLFAIAQGWAVNRWTAVGAGYELCINKGTSFFNLRSYNNETATVNGGTASNKYGIVLNGSDGYAAGNAWDKQPGYPVRMSSAGGDQWHTLFPLVTTTGPFPAYHFFAPDSKTLYAEVEITTGVFQRWGFGALDIFNPSCPGGGRFVYSTTSTHVTNSVTVGGFLATDADNHRYSLEFVPFRAADYTGPNDCGVNTSRSSASAVRAAFGSFNNWAGSGRTVGTTGLAMACQGGGCHDKVLRDFSPNPLNNVAVLLPSIVSLNVNNEFLMPIGTIPGIRYMDMTNYLPGEEFTLGTDTWKVFPWYTKGGIGYNRGIAYLKV